MVPFVIIKSNLARCFYSRNQAQLFDQIIRFLMTITAVLHLVSHIVFLVLETNTVKEYIDSVYLITATLAVLTSFLHTVSETATIFTLIDNIERVIEKKLEIPALKPIYIETHRIVEMICKIMNFMIAKMGAPVFILPKVILCYANYFTTDAGSKAFELPLPTWFPFQWKTPTGYLLAIWLQYAALFLAFEYLTGFLELAFGTFLFTLSFAKHMIISLHAINKKAKARKKAESNIFKQLKEFIDMHADVKEILYNFTNVYQTTIAVLFSWSIIAICMAMLLFQLEITSDELDTVVFLESMVYGFWAFAMVAICCEMGQQYSNAYENMDGVIVLHLDWYLLPMKIQRMLPTIKINTQQPFEVKCFGSSTCCRETFKKVVNKGYSFFMVLRKFYK